METFVTKKAEIFREFPRLSLRPLSEFRQSIVFDKTHEVYETASELQV